MSVWFEGSCEIQCTLEQVKRAIENYGEYCVGFVGLMPGITSVELQEEGNDFVIIKTNEGLMKRTSISKRLEGARILVELDEGYQAGSKNEFTSHYLSEFVTSKNSVIHRLVISEVVAPGLLGFLYRNFGKSNIGNAILQSTKSFFEKQES